MAKFICSLDNQDMIRDISADPEFSTFFDFEEGSELRTIVPFSIWVAYGRPAHIVVEIIN